MRLFLFGGAEKGEAERELKLIEAAIISTGVSELLHIPFARTVTGEEEWQGDWFHKNITIPGVTYVNAETEDYSQLKNPLVFISGGSEHVRLMEKILEKPELLKLIQNAEYIIGESAGAMALGERWRTGKRDTGPSRLILGLGILPNTIIEPHYTQRSLQETLKREMQEAGLQFGVGIDTVTGMEFDIKDFPKKYTTRGIGSVEIMENK